MKTKTIRQKVVFKAEPHEVYEALMSSKIHAEFTGDSAKISRKEGGLFSAYGRGLHGTNSELVADKKIVQNWRCEMEGWPESHFSTASFSLKKVKGGTELSFLQTKVPEQCYASISDGWVDYYWNKMKAYFKLKKTK